MEKNDLRTLLDEQIDDCFDNLKDLRYGDQEFIDTVDTLTKLYKLKLEEDKNASEFSVKLREEKFKEEQTGRDNVYRIVKLVTDCGSLVLNLIFFASWMKKGFEFEQNDGVITSSTFRDFSHKFLNFLCRN